MKKIICLSFVLFFVATVIGIRDIYNDRQFLREHIIRLHVVANSDSAEDQRIKLCVRDAIIQMVDSLKDSAKSKEDMLAILSDSIPKLESIANNVLTDCGTLQKVKITLREENFGKRVYDTFTLPSGIYDSLRVEIGTGEGKNWWCVLFPSLCIPAAGEGFNGMATGAGFSQGLTNTISNSGGYKVRFFLLDCIGKIENLFY